MVIFIHGLSQKKCFQMIFVHNEKVQFVTATTRALDECHRYRRQIDWIWRWPRSPRFLDIHFADTSTELVVWHLQCGQILDSQFLNVRNTSWNPIAEKR